MEQDAVAQRPRDPALTARILVCDRTGAVYHLDAGGKLLRTRLSTRRPARTISALDVANGGFYFTSPYGSEREPIGKIYYVDRDGVTDGKPRTVSATPTESCCARDGRTTAGRRKLGQPHHRIPGRSRRAELERPGASSR